MILKKIYIFLAFSFICISFSACKEKTADKKETNPVVLAPAFLSSPSEIIITETGIDALPAWRDFKQSQPILVIFSDSPELALIPPPINSTALEFLMSSSPNDLLARMPFTSAEPLFLPEMAVRCAISAQYVSEVIWVPPLDPEAISSLTVDALRKHLLDRNFVDEEEVRTFRKENFGFSGRVEGVPFKVMFPTTMTFSSARNHITHIDSSFFTAAYKNEIKSPLFSLMLDSLTEINKAKINTLASTISLGNYGERIPIRFRFIGKAIARIAHDPSLLEKAPPKEWQLHTKILYLENFFQQEDILQLATEWIQLDRKDPAAYYELFRAQQLNKLPAYEALDQAIALDRAYALEFLHQANQEQNPKLKMDFLARAADYFPNDLVIQLRLTQALMDTGNQNEAVDLAKRLQKQSWSPVFFPQVPEFLSRLNKLQQPD